MLVFMFTYPFSSFSSHELSLALCPLGGLFKEVVYVSKGSQLPLAQHSNLKRKLTYKRKNEVGMRSSLGHPISGCNAGAA